MQRGARVGEDPGGGGGEGAGTLDLPLGQGHVGGRQIRTGFKVKKNKTKTGIFPPLVQEPIAAVTERLCRWEMAALSVTRSVLSLLSHLGLISVDAEMLEYLR